METALSLEQLLRLVVEKKATDLHLTVNLPPQLRINGTLELTELPILKPEDIQRLAYSILSENQIKHFEQGRELDTSYGISGLGRFRVNLYFQRGSLACAIRFIPYEIPSLESLGLPEVVKKFVNARAGLILVTGAVGSGKSTTLASLIEYINSFRRCHIITIEDPIEYLHKHRMATIDQREVGRDTLSFAHALRYVFRQDPDVVMIGEMRDLETMRTALTLAETGHLILGTLHTMDATHAITRIVDVFPPYQQQQIRVQLSLVLIGVIVQQLIPRLDGKGRALAVEIMKVTPAISNLIRENQLQQIYSLIQTGKSEGMVTMNQSLLELYKNKLISAEEALKRSSDPKELMSLMGRR
ncbi:MAG: type IV pilus twitching motility protein PilT [Candidatus Omnitrophica bacterium]|nr:type IV pilus twitching motility protein PilT [Candidatus Omnitrophota bacterium]MCM8793904.1 type IV pilus twitching motility protein PilT [Candidatus Omnitrophota bacterium]